MSLGGHGTANVTGNMIPAEMVELSTPWTDPEVTMAFQSRYLRYLPMLKLAYSELNPVPTKTFLDAVGMPAGPLRRPLRQLSPVALEPGLILARELGLDDKSGFDLS